MTVSKKVGRAVLRVRLKRQIREIYRRWRERSKLPAFDLVVHAKPQMAAASFEQIESELQRLLRALISNRQEAS
jgi:ribonuclease P protein component